MPPNPIFIFGIHELDEDCWELRRHGSPVPVQPRVFRLLLYLARHRVRVVGRDELLEALWPNVCVTNAALLRAVSLARRAIGERAGNGTTIRTYHGRGYRFCAPVQQIEPLVMQTLLQQAR